MRSQELNNAFFVLVLILVTWIFFDLVSPYFYTILWATIITVIFYPVKKKIQEIIVGHNGLASLITTIIICLIVFIPLIIIISSLVIELNIVYSKLRYNDTHLPEGAFWLLSHIPEWLKSLFNTNELNNALKIQQKLSELALKSGQYIAGSAFFIGKGTFDFAISLSVMLYLLFFLLKDWPYLTNQILNFLPLSNFVKKYLFTKFITVAIATVRGTIVVAVTQGILGGIVFFIIDIDGSVLWGTLISFLSLIPSIGPAIIWLPTAIYLFSIQQVWKGLFTIIFFLLIIGLIDNFLRPLLVGKDTKLPDYLILISTLGGIKIYGINGFIIGPLITAMFIACWNLFSTHKYIDKYMMVIKRSLLHKTKLK